MAQSNSTAEPLPAAASSSVTATASPTSPASSRGNSTLLIGAIIGIALIAVVLWQFGPQLTGNVTATNSDVPIDSADIAAPIVPAGAISANLAQDIRDNEVKKRTLSKAKYTAQTYAVKRDEYDLYEKAAAAKNMTLDEITSFFFECCDLTKESDIFDALPAVPADFSSVAFDVATGTLHQIGQLGPEFYKQPEFYFHVGETAGANRFIAFKEWSNPHLEDWGDYGLGTYPNQQWGSVSKTGPNSEAVAVVFVMAGWGIQNYQGVSWVVDAKSLEFFDVTVEAESTGRPYHLISPTFPQFGANWADKITVRAKPKPNTPPGTYNIAINPVAPPKELSSKWNTEHRGVYVEIGSIRPGGNQVDLFVNVV